MFAESRMEQLKALKQQHVGSEARRRKRDSSENTEVGHQDSIATHRRRQEADFGTFNALTSPGRKGGYTSESSIEGGLAVQKNSLRHASKLSIAGKLSVNDHGAAPDEIVNSRLGSPTPPRSLSAEMFDVIQHRPSALSSGSYNNRASNLTEDHSRSISATSALRSSLLGVVEIVHSAGKLRASDVQKAVLSYMERLVKSKVFILALTFVSVFALYGDDLRLAFFEKEDDKIFNWITFGSICLFTFEISLSCIALRDYAFSFFFFLDVISTVSLVLDLTFVWEALVGYEGFSVEDETTSASGDGALGQSEYARAGRSSRVGTRLVRMLRVFRLVRVTRIFKFFIVKEQKEAARAKIRMSVDLTEMKLQPGEKMKEVSEATAKESRVGQKLSERTTLLVILLVLSMLIFVPLLDAGDPTLFNLSSAEYGADVITQAWKDLTRAEYAGASANVLQERRLYWEEQLLTYIAVHNHEYAECPQNAISGADCAADWLFKLCFLGFVANHHPNGTSLLATRDYRVSRFSWDTFWHSLTPRYLLGIIPGDFPEDIEGRLLQPWSSTCSEPGFDMYGVSLLRNDPCPWMTRRPQEITWFWALQANRGVDISTQGQMVFFFDIAEAIKWQALMSMFQTTFIIAVLLIGSILFSKDTDALVLQPIEAMIIKINRIRRDPLYATTMGDEIFHRRMLGKSSQPLKSSTIMSMWRRLQRRTRERITGKKAKRSSILQEQRPPEKRPLETKILENTIIKLGSLLALGFGEAGTDIVGENLEDDGTTVNVLIPGRSVEAIYGYCQINDFTSTTEVLGEKTVVLVNKVALIVHTIIDGCLGSANKNMGEAFLLVWRLDRFDGRLRPKIADLSVLSFIQVVVEVNRDVDLAAYREHPGLLARHESYRVKLTFGLHVGYSIEGAIGSEFKIDASYLSSHVTLATCLGSMALCYDVVILMSEPLVCCCSNIFQFHFRAIDKVLMEGAKSPMRIFTVDLDSEAVFVNHSKHGLRKEPNRYLARVLREQRKQSKLDDSYEPIVSFNTDRHIQRMRAVYFLEFFQDFEKGFLNYEAGEWGVACQVLLRTSHMLRQRTWHYDKVDGPSCALLDYMHGFKYKAPVAWPGFRKVSAIVRLNSSQRCILEI